MTPFWPPFGHVLANFFSPPFCILHATVQFPADCLTLPCILIQRQQALLTSVGTVTYNPPVSAKPKVNCGTGSDYTCLLA